MKNGNQTHKVKPEMSDLKYRMGYIIQIGKLPSESKGHIPILECTLISSICISNNTHKC